MRSKLILIFLAMVPCSVFGADAVPVNHVVYFDLFPKDVADKIRSLKVNVLDASKLDDAILNLVCNQKVGRFTPQFKIVLAIPKPGPNISLDSTAKTRSKFMQMVHEFLKINFFNGMSKYLSGSRTAMDNRAFQPALQPELAQFYQNANYDIKTAPVHLEQPEHWLERYLAVYVDPTARKGILVPKALFIQNGDKITGVNGNDAMYMTDPLTRAALSLNSFFVISDKKEGAAYPVSYAFAEDFTTLTERFVILDKADSTSKSLSHDKNNWKKFFTKNVSYTETPRDDGSFVYDVKLDLSEFCVFGTAKSGMVTR